MRGSFCHLHHLAGSMLNHSLFRRRGMGFGYRREESGRGVGFGYRQHEGVRTETALEVTKIYKPIYRFFNFFSVEEIGWIVSRLVLPVVSFGRICVEPLTSPSPPQKFNMFGYRRDERRRLELDKRAASLVGLVILALALSVGNWLIQTSI